MITWITFKGKRHLIETNARGDIVKKDGIPVNEKHKPFQESKKYMERHETGFAQRGSNRR